MAERYIRLFTLSENLYFRGSPIVIAAGALLKDNKTGRVLAQLKLRNIQRKIIKAVTVQIIPYDIAGRRLGTGINYQYLDLVEVRDAEFGQKIPIMLPDATIRSFSVSVLEVIFIDQSIWAVSTTTWTPMIKRIPLNKMMSDYQLENQFRIKYGAQCTDVFQEYQDLWYCSCGAVNQEKEASCHSCGLQAAVLATVDLNKLKVERDKRLVEEATLQAKQKAEEEKRRAEEKAEQEKMREEKELRKKKAKKIRQILIIGSTTTIFTLFLAISVFRLYSNYIKAKQEEATRLLVYNEAITLSDLGKYDDAIELFSELGDYRDSAIQLEQAQNKEKEKKETAYKKCRTSISSGKNYTIGLLSDGTVISAGPNIDGRCNVSKWNNIISVYAGNNHTVGLRADGTVVAIGKNDCGQCDVSRWRDIVAITAGVSYTVGLCTDGTVVATGLNNYGQCNVSEWRDIVAIAAGAGHTVGLCSDGTVVVVGRDDYKQCDVSEWRDIVAIAAGDFHTVGLRSDGTVIATGWNKHGQCDNSILTWRDIIAIAAGGSHTVGLHTDGTVVAVGRNNNISEWTDIIAISAGYSHTVGLHSNGTVIATGENDSGECDVSNWNNIKLPDSY